jgi:septum formation protein
MRKDFMYLASASPRRRALLEQIGVPFEVRPAEISEAGHPGETPDVYVSRVAQAKAGKVWDDIGASEDRAVLAADTAVIVDGQVLGKPDDSSAALEMLAMLSGRTHRVLTAVSVMHGKEHLIDLSSNEVRFRVTTDRERLAYVATGEPMGKAGSYAIQGMGAVFVAHISGSYSAVMGLPLELTAQLLREIGLPAWLHQPEGQA